MSISIVYLIKLLLLPPGCLLILALVGLWFRKRRYGLMVTAVCLVLTLILSLPVVINLWANYWERVPPLSRQQVAEFKPQALVVIGGGVDKSAEEYQSPVTVGFRTLIRVRYAAKLAWELGLPILVSGGSVLGRDCASEASLMAEVLENEFKTPVAWLEDQSRNTAENARFSREVLGEYGIDKIVLVTQAYHMPRALTEFRKAGFEVLPAPTAFIGHGAELNVLDWLPSPLALMNSFLLAHEAIGMLWYRVAY